MFSPYILCYLVALALKVASPCTAAYLFKQEARVSLFASQGCLWSWISLIIIKIQTSFCFSTCHLLL